MNTKSALRLFGAGLLSATLVAGCSTAEEDFSIADVDSTMAPLLGPDNAVKGEYIVVLKDSVGVQGMNTAMNRISQLSLKSAESRVMSQLSVIPAFTAKLSDRDLDSVRKDDSVAYVEKNGLVHIVKQETNSGRPLPDGIDRIDQTSGRNGIYEDNDNDGTGVDIYIVDTGIRLDHVEFDGPFRNNRARAGFDAIGDGQNGNDCNGHGTHVASTAGGAEFGVADDADLIAVRVLACNGSGSFAGVIDGINFVAQDCSGDCVANMSLGGGFSQAINDAVNAAVASGIPFAVASGNDNSNSCNFSPASAANAITVDAAADNDNRASFSNRGTCSDIWAPGVSILGADIGSPTDTQSISGTSMASPHVAGVAAKVLDCNPGASPAQVQAIIEANAVQGIVGDSGASPNLFLQSNVCGGAPPPPPPPPPPPGGSCENRCGEFDAGAECQCDDACEQFGDCCDDKAEQCDAPPPPDPNTSCNPEVRTCTFNGQFACQCDAACVQFGDCCPDVGQFCQ